MSRNSSPARNQMRLRLAHLAARLMAEDGLADFAQAKRKAARQLGADDTQNLPNNAEIEQALRDYHALYQADEQRQRLRALRTQAVTAMQDLSAFDPHLTGSVLTGTASRYSSIDLMLFADSLKEVELYLLNHNIAYKSGEKRFRFGETSRQVPFLTLVWPGLPDVGAAIFTPADLKNAPRSPVDGRPMPKARLNEVKSLLGAEIENG